MPRFQSVTTRSSGFNTIDIGNEGDNKAMAIQHMFIGAASGSTGGGVKITTLGLF